MQMLPIFLMGVFCGGITVWSFTNLKRNIPSDTKFHIQEAELVALKNDNETLNKLVDKLYKEIDELKQNQK